MRLTLEEKQVAALLGVSEADLIASKSGKPPMTAKPAALSTALQPSKPATSLRPSTSPSTLTEAERLVAQLLELDADVVARAKARDAVAFAKRGRAEVPESGAKLEQWRARYLADDGPGWTQT